MVNKGRKYNESCKVYEKYANTPSKAAKQLYYYTQWAGRFVCNPDFYIERQNFSSVLILYTLQGSGKLIYRGKEYLLSSEHFALLNCIDPHIFYPLEGEDWKFCFIHFKGGESLALYEHIYDLNGGAVFDENDRIRAYVEGCIRDCQAKIPGYEARMSKKLTDILHSCVIQIQNAQKGDISLICEYITEHCDSALSTEFLAQEFGFSRCYFSTYFKKQTGSSLHEYLLCCRLDRAKVMLWENKYSVEEIAQQTGFGDTGTFIRAFKRKEKLTPVQYRKSTSANREN